MKVNSTDTSPPFPLQLLFVSQITALPNSVFERKNYEYLLIEYVLKGRGFVEIDSEYHICQADSLYILPPGKDHKYGSFADDPWEKIFFVCEGELIRHLLTAYNLDGLYFLENCADLLHYFKELSVLKSAGEGHFDAALLIHKLFQDIFIRKFGSDSKQQLSSLVVKLKTELDRNLENKITMDMLGRQLGCSKVYLIRMFKKELGVSPYDYLMEKRIESAKILLTHSSLFIKEIAQRFCFSDQYYFSNYFKKKTGVSPRHFRQNS